MMSARHDLGLMAGVTDCHLHVIGDGKKFPYSHERAYEPPHAPLEELMAFHETHGVVCAVLVQVSVYGTDNGLLLETLQHDRARFRGVAVTDPYPDDRLLAQLADNGVVGLRLNLMHGGGPDAGEIARYAAVCRDAGFHLQIYVDGLLLPEMAPALRKIDVPIVFDHFGGIPASMGTRNDGPFQTLAEFLSDGAWVKLSAPYRVSSQKSGFRDVVPLARRLLEIAPDRCVWGSDWPHVATAVAINSSELFSLMAEIVEGPTQRNVVFSGNAKRLYGFD
ncbi:amidohydrolase family protein [Rhizobium sp. BK376]|uniref:amidohydrolase family protein n=1 Tax=Rhizobium sp. BK376 TaxID=2512149 RepID=UPI00104D8BB4|nr:amidohydrolase family protein [Rhizobium sp. BK376]TCR69568.1 putative TIM-barrel fold metal-dependent hydrolase [Rhizobium sp. BK376]